MSVDEAIDERFRVVVLSQLFVDNLLRCGFIDVGGEGGYSFYEVFGDVHLECHAVGRQVVQEST